MSAQPCQANPVIVARIQQRLVSRSRRELNVVNGMESHAGDPEAKGARHAAVLLALRLQQEKLPQLLFVLRSTNLSHHRGQIAFPGGRVDPGDNTHTAAALREAEEELAIGVDDLCLLGLLDDQYTSASDHVVTPVLGILKRNCEPRLATSENEAFFWVELQEMLQNCQRVPLRAHGEPWQREQQWIFPSEHGTIWGLSSRILRNFLNQSELLEDIRELLLP